ncbi:MAG TPA: LysM peptidoglycan-binding domain-containing protein [Anaerolineales bacterium]|nr:LysM peptidoglycan-binding domain-containing protein [Anaerolineales bacterium]
MRRFSLAFPVFFAIVGLTGVLLALPSARRPASAAPALQLTDFPTPTPGEDGRILYTVQEGDTLWRIAAVAGISLDELRRINNLTADAIINVGQVLLLGFGGPALEGTPTPESVIPTVVPGSSLPTPTSGPGTGEICVLLYEDVNGDAIRQEEEVAVPGGAISLADRAGTVSLQAETIPGPADPLEEPPRICFPDLLEGDYTVTVAIPDGYNATTDLSASFRLVPGESTLIDIGAQRSSAAVVEQQAQAPEEGGRAPLFGLIGGALLLAGVGLAAYALISGRR